MNTPAAFKAKDLVQKSLGLFHEIGATLNHLTPFGDLLLRGWVASAFWVSGLIKIQNWDSTLYLFQSEY